MSEPLTLSDIPGLGPRRRTALAELGIRDLEGLLALKLEELAAVRGVGLAQARRLQEFLRLRGMVLAEDGPSGTLVVVGARTAADVEIVADAVAEIESQSEVEAEAEADMEEVAEALARARLEAAHPESGPADAAGNGHAEVTTPEPEALQPEREALDREAEPLEAEPKEPAEVSLRREVEQKRLRLPETALELMDAIRQAAVAPRLTRQLTRLLITAGRLTSEEGPLARGHLKAAEKHLDWADRAMRRMAERGRLGRAAQEKLAEKIRARRKELERLLEAGAE